ncbi:polysaccharide deacetylase family protein [Pelagibius sp. Alg239-R121]|uniref:polysaccharide deacetylase family protein n=1 Tax=Pelagibius sp. Alg239-R121 TaxID=2993448 RepID=UPI0024A642B9|nr:polysaccharide deacetylase family protein [Pelagibius sp. Alg239-R121]
MTGWDGLRQELGAWQQAGLNATFWWRDDDAVAPSAALERLLALSLKHSAGLALAVIPEQCETALAKYLADWTGAETAEISVLQHGIAHRNTAPEGEKKTELSAAASIEETIEQLTAGRHRLQTLFGERMLPVLVPPWNRITPELVPRLRDGGFTGLSTYKARKQTFPAPGLLQVNTHADLLRWKPERGFLGETEALALLCDHLHARRAAFARTDSAHCSLEATGILTHHLVHDSASWDFLDKLLEFLSLHPATKLLAPSEAFSHADNNDGAPDPARNSAADAPERNLPVADGVKKQKPARKGKA